MATRAKRLTVDATATMIHSTLAMASSEGLTMPEILGATGLSRSQFLHGWPLLKDTLAERGTPINVSKKAPYRYSIPKPIEDAESREYELRRAAILADTSLQRLQIHAAAARDHHPHERDRFDAMANAANKARRAIHRAVPSITNGSV
jgi:hypothetical protein